MNLFTKFSLGTLVMGLTCVSMSCADDGKNELVKNPKFMRQEDQPIPEHWQLWEPAWKKAGCTVQCLSDGLLLEALGKPYAVGGVFQDVPDIRGGHAYVVHICCEPRNLAFPYQSVIVRLTWTHDGKPLHPAGMLIRGPILEEGSVIFDEVLTAPSDANGARLSLDLKWPRGGSVLWKHASIQPTAPPAQRRVKVGTIYLSPNNSSTERNLNLWCEQIDAAGRLGLDIVCLGEGITKKGVPGALVQFAEPIPGPSTERLAQAARRNHLWVIAGLYEREGDKIYNTAVLLDRDGKLAGKYRKTHLPREEWKEGITPGDTYPIFKTDFGTIAIQICYDWFFPEPEEIFAMKGAEIIFAPTWGNTLPDRDGRVDGESTFRVRARDNGVYMVPSVYSGNSLIIDPMGRILASSDGHEGVFWAEIDLNKRECLPWVGYWRAIGPRDRMPTTYAPLLKEPTLPTY